MPALKYKDPATGQWVMLMAAAGSDNRGRSWAAQRGGVSDAWAAGTWGIHIELDLPADAPAGRYEVTHQCVVSAAATTPGLLRLLFGAVNLTNDVRADNFSQLVTYTVVRQATHTGGAVHISAQHWFNTQTGTVYANGTHLLVVYLGPA